MRRGGRGVGMVRYGWEGTEGMVRKGEVREAERTRSKGFWGGERAEGRRTCIIELTRQRLARD